MDGLEVRLRALASRAVTAGRYDAGERVMAAAKGVAYLADRHLRGPSAEGGPEDPKPTDTPRPSRRRKAKARTRSKPKGYPKFLRAGSDLVRIGWSVRQREEYKHKAPRRLAVPLAEGIASLSVDGRPVPSEAFLPLLDPGQGREAPSYQVYLALSWLVQCGLVVKHGRQGYTVPDGERLVERVEAAWKELPAR